MPAWAHSTAYAGLSSISTSAPIALAGRAGRAQGSREGGWREEGRRRGGRRGGGRPESGMPPPPPPQKEGQAATRQAPGSARNRLPRLGRHGAAPPAGACRPPANAAPSGPHLQISLFFLDVPSRAKWLPKCTSVNTCGAGGSSSRAAHEQVTSRLRAGQGSGMGEGTRALGSSSVGPATSHALPAAAVRSQGF